MWLCPISTTDADVWAKAAWIASASSTYSQIAFRGLPWNISTPSAEALGSRSVEVAPGLVVEHLLRPRDGTAGLGVELRDVHGPQHDEVVVADQADVGAVANDPAALVRARPVPDQVAEAPDRVRLLPREVVEDHLQGV